MFKLHVVVLLLGSLPAAGEPPTSDKPSPAPGEKKAGPAPKKRPPVFTIGKETTYVTGPIDKDGYIDYAAALNECLSKGVTPANNANVLIWKALGPRPEGTKMSAEYFKWLGIDEPPAKGDYFIPLAKHLKEQIDGGPPAGGETVDAELRRCMSHSWKAARYPNIADWLKANEKPLTVVLEATRRTHYFSPLVPRRTEKGSGGLFSALLPAVQTCRDLASALTARAMLHLGEGRVDEAWRDLLACHRLGRLVARGSTLIESLVGIAIDTIAGKADLVFLERAGLDSQRIMACLGDLRKLPPMSPLADKVDLCDRLGFLDCIMLVDRTGIQALEPLGAGTSPKIPEPIARLVMKTIDWEPAMRNGNYWFDRMVKAMRTTDRATREKRLDAIERDLKALKAKSREMVENPLKLLLAKDTGKALGETIGNVMICLLMPAVHKVHNAADRVEQNQHNLHLAFALAAYRHDHGRYPEKLKTLAPKYLATIPQDLFSGAALVYRPADKGYLLYSVGINGIDEQGRSYEDDPRGDDLVVRMPLPAPRAKK
jgi:hypothetical protein